MVVPRPANRAAAHSGARSSYARQGISQAATVSDSALHFAVDEFVAGGSLGVPQRSTSFNAPAASA
jgi:hypothetical protein